MTSLPTVKESWSDIVVRNGDTLGIEFAFDSWPPSPRPTGAALNTFDRLDEDGWNVYLKHRGDEWSSFPKSNKAAPVTKAHSRGHYMDDFRQDAETPRAIERTNSKDAANQDQPRMTTIPIKHTTPLNKRSVYTASSIKIRPPPAPQAPSRDKFRHFNSDNRIKTDKDNAMWDSVIDSSLMSTSSRLLRLPSVNNSVQLDKIFRRSVGQLDEFCGKSDDGSTEGGFKIDDDDNDSALMSPVECVLDAKLARALNFGASSPPFYPTDNIVQRGYGQRAGLGLAAEFKKTEVANSIRSKVLVDRNTNNVELKLDNQAVSDGEAKATVTQGKPSTILNHGHNEGSENIEKDAVPVNEEFKRKQRIPTGDVIADRHQWLMDAFKGRDQGKVGVQRVSEAQSTHVVPSKIDKTTTDMFGGQIKTKSAVQRRREEYEQKVEELKAAANKPKLKATTHWENKYDGSYKKKTVTVKNFE